MTINTKMRRTSVKSMLYNKAEFFCPHYFVIVKYMSSSIRDSLVGLLGKSKGSSNKESSNKGSSNEESSNEIPVVDSSYLFPENNVTFHSLEPGLSVVPDGNRVQSKIIRPKELGGTRRRTRRRATTRKRRQKKRITRG